MRLGLCLSRYLADVLTRNIQRKIVSLVVCISRFNAQYCITRDETLRTRGDSLT